MSGLVGLWFGAGFFYLVLLAWQDLRSGGWVDDRRNWFMLGLSVSLMSLGVFSFWFVLCLVGLSLGVSLFFRKRRVFGDGDVSAFGWLFLGFGLIGLDVLFLWLGVFVVLTVVWGLLKNYVFGVRGCVPFFPVFLLSFMVVFGFWLLV